MKSNAFIFTPGIWLGEGKMTLSASSQHVLFYTKWVVSEIENGSIMATQTVEMQGVQEPVINSFLFTEITSSSFTLTAQNSIIGITHGKGVKDEKKIAWEFPLDSPLHGFEVFELQENGDYAFRAEYGEQPEFRSLIEGLIWKKLTD